MARVTAALRALWTPVNLSRNSTFCDWLFGFGWLFFCMAVYTICNPALSVGFFKLAGWLITSGSLAQRFEARLWPFKLDYARLKRRVAAAMNRLAAAIYRAEKQAERIARVLGMLCLAAVGLIILMGVLFAQ